VDPHGTGAARQLTPLQGALERWRGPLRFGVIALGLLAWVAFHLTFTDAGDAHAYFTADSSHPYTGHQGEHDAYLYSPAFAQAIEPLRWLGWENFRAVWRGTELAALTVLSGPLVGLLLPFAPVQTEIRLGNINLLLGLAVVLGFRWPAAWAFVLLTKVTPGVGMLWFVLRREWRNLAIALGATLAISAASFLLAPSLWFEWLTSLVGQSDPTNGVQNLITAPLPLRMIAAAILVAWGARTDRQWTVLVAAFVAMPTTAIWNASCLIGLVYLARRPSRDRSAQVLHPALAARPVSVS
jgi:hypothetical protein